MIETPTPLVVSGEPAGHSARHNAGVKPDAPLERLRLKTQTETGRAPDRLLEPQRLKAR